MAKAKLDTLEELLPGLENFLQDLQNDNIRPRNRKRAEYYLSRFDYWQKGLKSNRPNDLQGVSRGPVPPVPAPLIISPTEQRAIARQGTQINNRESIDDDDGEVYDELDTPDDYEVPAFISNGHDSEESFENDSDGDSLYVNDVPQRSELASQNATAAKDLQDVIISGKMKRLIKKMLVKKWIENYCVLIAPNNLRLYDNENSCDPRVDVSIGGGSSVTSMGKYQGETFVLKIQLPANQEPIFLASYTKKDENMWKKKLLDCGFRDNVSHLSSVDSSSEVEALHSSMEAEDDIQLPTSANASTQGHNFMSNFMKRTLGKRGGERVRKMVHEADPEAIAEDDIKVKLPNEKEKWRRCILKQGMMTIKGEAATEADTIIILQGHEVTGLPNPKSDKLILVLKQNASEKVRLLFPEVQMYDSWLSCLVRQTLTSPSTDEEVAEDTNESPALPTCPPPIGFREVSKVNVVKPGVVKLSSSTEQQQEEEEGGQDEYLEFTTPANEEDQEELVQEAYLEMTAVSAEVTANNNLSLSVGQSDLDAQEDNQSNEDYYLGMEGQAHPKSISSQSDSEISAPPPILPPRLVSKGKSTKVKAVPLSDRMLPPLPTPGGMDDKVETNSKLSFDEEESFDNDEKETGEENQAVKREKLKIPKKLMPGLKKMRQQVKKTLEPSLENVRSAIHRKMSSIHVENPTESYDEEDDDELYEGVDYDGTNNQGIPAGAVNNPGYDMSSSTSGGGLSPKNQQLPSLPSSGCPDSTTSDLTDVSFQSMEDEVYEDADLSMEAAEETKKQHEPWKKLNMGKLKKNIHKRVDKTKVKATKRLKSLVENVEKQIQDRTKATKRKDALNEEEEEDFENASTDEEAVAMYKDQNKNYVFVQKDGETCKESVKSDDDDMYLDVDSDLPIYEDTEDPENQLDDDDSDLLYDEVEVKAWVSPEGDAEGEAEVSPEGGAEVSREGDAKGGAEVSQEGGAEGYTGNAGIASRFKNKSPGGSTNKSRESPTRMLMTGAAGGGSPRFGSATSISSNPRLKADSAIPSANSSSVPSSRRTSNASDVSNVSSQSSEVVKGHRGRAIDEDQELLRKTKNRTLQDTMEEKKRVGADRLKLQDELRRIKEERLNVKRRRNQAQKKKIDSRAAGKMEQVEKLEIEIEQCDRKILSLEKKEKNIEWELNAGTSVPLQSSLIRSNSLSPRSSRRDPATPRAGSLPRDIQPEAISRSNSNASSKAPSIAALQSQLIEKVNTAPVSKTKAVLMSRAAGAKPTLSPKPGAGKPSPSKGRIPVKQTKASPTPSRVKPATADDKPKQTSCVAARKQMFEKIDSSDA